MGWSDARNERDRAEGRGNRDRDRPDREKKAAEARNREAMGRARGGGSGSFQGGSGLTRDKMRAQDQIGANVAQAQRDYQGRGDSFIDRVGNAFAGAFGFNEMDPTRPGYSAPGRPGMTGRADWGFDPVGLAGGLAGSAFGIPGLGFVADQLSSLAGRPLEMNMGPSVFGGQSGSVRTTPSAGGFGRQMGGGTGNGQWGGYGNMAQRPKAAQSSIPSQSNQWGPAPTPQMPNLLAPQMPGLNQPSGGLLGMTSWR